MARRPKSEAELEYAKQVRRIKQAISRETKRGFIIPDTVLPKRPKKITQASVNRLKKITPKTIRGKAYVTTDDGVRLTVKQGIKAGLVEAPKRGAPRVKGYIPIIKPISQKKSKTKESTNPPSPPTKEIIVEVTTDESAPETAIEDDAIAWEEVYEIYYENFRDMIMHFAWAKGGEVLYDWFVRLEHEYTPQQLGEFVKLAVDNGFEMKDYMLYDANEALSAVNDLMRVMPMGDQDFRDVAQLNDYLDSWDEFYG